MQGCVNLYVCHAILTYLQVWHHSRSAVLDFGQVAGDAGACCPLVYIHTDKTHTCTYIFMYIINIHVIVYGGIISSIHCIDSNCVHTAVSQEGSDGVCV